MMKDGTAIGLGLANAVRNLKDSKAKSKVIILLTDGINNAGSITPMEAAKVAGDLGIRVYTIGIRRRELAQKSPESGGSEATGSEFAIDPDMLKNIAQMTGGSFFSSTDVETLQEIYGEIDRLEKSRMDLSEFGTKEAYFPFALIATCLILMEILLKNTVLRSFP